MSTWLTLTRRDLAGYFLNLTGYVIIAAAVFLMGFSFVVLMMKLQQEPTPMPVTATRRIAGTASQALPAA